jgi:IS30 family transposase
MGSLPERERIFGFLQKGLSLRAVSKLVHRNVGTISRELGRHSKYGKAYLPCHAQKEAVRIGLRQRRRSALKNPVVFLYVRTKLRNELWSPETIAGRLKIDHPGQSICHETIYRYIYSNPRTKRDRLWQYLDLHRKRRMFKNGRKVKEYTKLTEAIPIQNRPETINNRSEVGHWETDNMEGVRSDKTAISVTIERLLRLTKLTKLEGHTAKVKTDAIITRLQEERKINPEFVKSITFDRGPENSGYKEIGEKLKVDTYACNPYHSWEKGGVENMNKRIRRFIPKGSSIEHITQQYLTLLETKLNNTPRKVLGYLTPNEFQYKMLSSSQLVS